MKKQLYNIKLFLIFSLFFFLTRYHNLRKFDANIDINKINSSVNIGGGADGVHFLEIAINLNKNLTYSEFGIKPSESATWRAPIWPIFLCILISITHNLKTIILLKCLFLFVIIFYTVWKSKFNPNFKLIILFFIILEPQFAKYNSFLLTEDLSATFLFISTFLLIENIWFKLQIYYIQFVLIAISILIHPITIFFNFFILIHLIYLLFKRNKRKKLFMGVIFFTIIVTSWPLRNSFVFDKTPFITSSQGATFSKGWNDSVLYKFNNTQGDLADEGLNLKYLIDRRLIINPTTLNLKEAYTSSTILFIKNSNSNKLLRIAFKKIVSNFNPFPESLKVGFIETFGSLFRLIYLLVFVLLLILKKPNSNYNLIAMLFFYIYLSQTLMSVCFYTGLRFNATYSLTLLFLTLLFMNEFISKLIKNKPALLAFKAKALRAFTTNAGSRLF